MLGNTVNNYGEALTRQLSVAAKDSILSNNRLALDVVLQDLVKNKDIQGAAIIDSNLSIMSAEGYYPKQEFYHQQLIGLLQNKTSADVQVLKWQDYDARRKVVLLNSYIFPITLKDVTLGHAVVTLNNHNLNQLLKSSFSSIAVLTILTVLLSIIIAIYISKRISRPIDNLMDASQQIQDGNLEFRFQDKRRDEIGQLMRSLNNMADGLVQKREVEKTFSKFVSENIANEILANIDDMQLAGKQTDASVMFADIVGFTSLSETLAPADIANMLNEYFSEISEIATKYHGSINKYVGDCVMIIFGTPLDDPQHSLHACLCALEIRGRLQEFNQQRKQHKLATVEFRIGINSGSMLAGTLGAEERMEYTVIGDNVNLASRVADLAQANEILIPENVVLEANLDSCLTTYNKGEIEIRGKKNRVSILGITAATQQPPLSISHG
jgi:adenylate cyclase